MAKNAYQQIALLWCWYQLHSMKNNAIQGLLWWKLGFAYWDFGILGYWDMDCISSLSPSICRSQLSRGIQFWDMLIMMMLIINIGSHHHWWSWTRPYHHCPSTGRSCQEGSSSRTCSRRPGFTDRVKAWHQDRPHTGTTECKKTGCVPIKNALNVLPTFNTGGSSDVLNSRPNIDAELGLITLRLQKQELEEVFSFFILKL